MNELRQFLFDNRDLEYLEFNSKLIPSVDKEKFIGVRAPMLKAKAKELAKENRFDFLYTLPHDYFEENLLHSYMLNEIKDFDKCVELIEAFLPYIDNWAVSDAISPKLFKKHPLELEPFISKQLDSGNTYHIRTAARLMLSFYIGDTLNMSLLDKLIATKNNDYYVKMVVAWYIAEVIIKNYDIGIKIIEDKRLEPWTHNKAIQKARESFRINDDIKEYLKSLKI